MKEELLEQIRLLRGYNYRKLREIDKTLNLLIDFARDDLKKINELEENIRNLKAKRGEE